MAAAQGTELLLPAAERPRHQARRTSHPPLEDEAVADTKKNCAKQGRTIVFIDQSGVSERPHRVQNITGLRPMMSDSQPKKMSVGVPMISPAPTI